MDTIIECSQLEKNYGPKKVLKGINLKVSAGTIYALLGTNGTGKTTLIRTLLGLIPKSAGEVRVLGAEPYKIGPQLRQRIGYVSEEQGLYNWMTVAEIIKFCQSIYSRWNEDLINKYLVQFNLDKRARIGTLSKGQTVKLALLLAIAPEPELLILDEPMSGLDPLAQYEFLQVIMGGINLEGRTIFFSTHNLADAEAVAQQIAIMDNGVIRASGGIDEVCHQIKKVKLKKQLPDDLLEQLKLGGVLTENSEGKTLLIPAEVTDQVAATLDGAREYTDDMNDPVTLQEAFLFFCSGGNRR